MNTVLGFTSIHRMPADYVAKFAACAAVALLAGCAANNAAPVRDARPPSDVAGQGVGGKPVVSAPPVILPPVKSGPADVTPSKPVITSDPTKFHTVQKGDTLYSIAFQHNLDRRELAAWNNIENLNIIRIGDQLRLTPPEAAGSIVATTTPQTSTPQTGAPQTGAPSPLVQGEVVTAPLILTPGVGPSSALESKPAATGGNTAQLKTEPKAGRVPYTDQAYAKLLNEPAAAGTAVASVTSPATPTATTTTSAAAPSLAGSDAVDFAWPISGASRSKLGGTFTDLSKGIDIPGARGTAVLAAAPGKVIYNKSGLRGYGRVVIIKHNDNWLSAYAHNEKILVAEDEVVKKGQKIAEMGSSDTDAVKLHFEIRNKGKPLDPLKYLPK